ncbi:hypothetical protein GOEFS_035_00170 [Gordonia effusa NBRC 100432]|uniref:Methyltransferase n=1 Tax=Gordonia effusa NBRC 100432 TaxID=1077974 RepID=H0QXD5_9ACTN|nr:hypothetical protein [Gordonia effusa]GAB17486.1 hypothetical protein GOEFS_035_00170 [Gordonia effusa NBRC 100432]
MASSPAVAAALNSVSIPMAVDLGYGGRPDTAVEMAARLRVNHPTLRLTGLEIDPDRVVPDVGDVEFAVGGFELAGLRPQLVRAFNVLRQYDEAEVAGAWQQMRDALAPGGVIVEGTCDEIGRRCCWILLDADGPRTLTLSWAPEHTGYPSELAPRLPKALIHRNVPGERIHQLLTEADRCWEMAASHASFGQRIRWREATRLLRAAGVPVETGRRTTRDNILTVPWDVVAPGR